MFGYASCYCGRNPQRLVYAGKIVMHVMKADGMRVVLDLFRETICEPGEAPHAHPHRKILPLDVARRDVLGVGISCAAECLGAIDLRRAVAAGRMRNLAIELDELRVIDIGTEAGLDRFQICSMPI